MQKSKEELLEFYEDRLNADIMKMLEGGNLSDTAFDILHYLELSLRNEFCGSAIGHSVSDLKAKGCRLFYVSASKQEGDLNITVHPAFGIYEIKLIRQYEEVEFHRLFDMLDWWQGKKELTDLHPDSYS